MTDFGDLTFLDAIQKDILEHKSESLHERDVIRIIEIAECLFQREGTVLELSAVNRKTIVCGDVHGQLYDVMYMLSIAGKPEQTQYLFLGDYVDRGHYSVETLVLLLSYKLQYPEHFFMLRGNHETRCVNQTYGFYEEIIVRFRHPALWYAFNELFDSLPWAAVIDGDIFCLHGGLSPQLPSVPEIAEMERRHEIAPPSAESDLVWSDPDEIEGWEDRNPRGAGIVFGLKPVEEFEHMNGLRSIVRTHQICQHGYQPFWNGRLVTLWSAPNYMCQAGNRAAFMEVKADGNFQLTQFVAVPTAERRIPRRDETETEMLSYFV